MTEKKENLKKSQILKKCIKLGQANKDSSIFVCLTFNEPTGIDDELKQTFFIVHTVNDPSPYESGYWEVSKSGKQFVYNNTNVLKDFVSVEAVNVWARFESDLKDDHYVFEIVVKNVEGKTRSIFVDNFNYCWNTKYYNPKVKLQDLVINVDGKLWLDYLDINYKRHCYLGGCYPDFFINNGETGVKVDKHKYRLLKFE